MGNFGLTWARDKTRGFVLEPMSDLLACWIQGQEGRWLLEMSLTQQDTCRHVHKGKKPSTIDYMSSLFSLSFVKGRFLIKSTIILLLLTVFI